MGYTTLATYDIVALQDWDTLDCRVKVIDELFELSYHFHPHPHTQILDNI